MNNKRDLYFKAVQLILVLVSLILLINNPHQNRIVDIILTLTLMTIILLLNVEKTSLDKLDKRTKSIKLYILAASIFIAIVILIYAYTRLSL